MFESQYIKVYAGNYLVAQLMYNKLQEIAISPVLKEDNLSGISAMLAEDPSELTEVYVHQDEFEKAMPMVEAVLKEIAE